ncbi:unnamed protein product [Discosporangium mesarthrocarpum]
MQLESIHLSLVSTVLFQAFSLNMIPFVACSRIHIASRQFTANVVNSACNVRRSQTTTTMSAGDGHLDFRVTDHAHRRNKDPNATFLVTGANRGIGLEVSRQLLGRTKGTVIAACRNPATSRDLHEMQHADGHKGRLDIVQMDVTDQATVDRTADHVKDHYGRLDLLFNVAGILGDAKTTPGPERSVRLIERDWLMQTLEVNAVGPVMLTKAMAPLLENSSVSRKGRGKSPGVGAPDGRPPAIVVNLSARVGSIGDNSLGGWHSYRMSKAMLNMWTKGLSLELKRKGVWAFSYHPGTTDTGLSEPFQKNVKPEKLFTPSYTVGQLLAIVDSMEEVHSGGFYAFDGSTVVW